MSLRHMRRAKGWSQEQLADISGVSIRTIQRLEAGEAPGLETQKALAAAFEYSLDDLNTQISRAGHSDHVGTHSEDTDSMESIVAQHGWKGLLFHLGTMMVVITWLLFLSREFEINSAVVYYVAFMWWFSLLVHVISLLKGRD